jgi:hypothetical protein
MLQQGHTYVLASQMEESRREHKTVSSQVKGMTEVLWNHTYIVFTDFDVLGEACLL